MNHTKSLFLLLAGFLLVCMTGCAATTASETTATPMPPTPTPSFMEIASNLHWSGGPSIFYQGSQNIYFDPVNLTGNPPPADIILITHVHTDHWSVADIAKIIGPETTLIIGPNVMSGYEAAKNELGVPATILEDGQTIEINGVSIEAVPAYDMQFHPKEVGGVGYIVTVDGIRIYHASDTAAFPGMANYQCDIALVPLYTKLDVFTAIAEIVPAKVIVLTNSDAITAPLIVNKLIQELGGEKQFTNLVVGPIEP